MTPELAICTWAEATNRTIELRHDERGWHVKTDKSCGGLVNAIATELMKEYGHAPAQNARSYPATALLDFLESPELVQRLNDEDSTKALVYAVGALVVNKGPLSGCTSSWRAQYRINERVIRVLRHLNQEIKDNLVIVKYSEDGVETERLLRNAQANAACRSQFGHPAQELALELRPDDPNLKSTVRLYLTRSIENLVGVQLRDGETPESWISALKLQRNVRDFGLLGAFIRN